MENEEWRDVPSYEGYYQVSESGALRSLTRMEWRNTKKESKRIRRGKVLIPSAGSDGYSHYTLMRDG
jgi:hypothetical protein